MNRFLYRIVFNKSRGLRMAVAETASGQGKGRNRSVASSAAVFAFSALALAVAVANAQIKADPTAPGNQRPTVLAAPNGVPLVNIQTPSAAGVSRNTYNQFDVNRPGVILNNSRTNVQTQLGGFVQGNPWLAGGPAKVILNEVNSSNPSLLKGPVEVGGSKADVVIANPSGIKVDGTTFINASNVVLTTGKPVLGASGNLESYRVVKGTVVVEGLGLDTRTASYADIYARAVEVNAGLWANYFRLVAGANDVPAADPTQPTPITPPADITKPRFALDIAAIGGMYAGHIFLVGNEYGLGVNHQGAMASGELVLLANGWLTNTGALQASGNLQVQAQGVSSSGTVSAGGNGSLTATDIANTGLIAAQGSMAIKAQQVSNAGGQVQSVGDLSVDAGPGAINNTSGLLRSNGTTQLTGSVITNSATSGPEQGIEGRSVSLSATTLANAAGAIRADNAVTINTGAALDNTKGFISAGKTLTVQDSPARALALSNAGGTLIGGETARISAGAISGAGKVLSEGTLDINVSGDLAHTGEITANGDVRIISAGNVTVRAGNIYTQTGSDVIAPGGDVDVKAKSVLINEARETNTSQTEQRFKQSGLTVAITSPVITAAQTAQSMARAAGNTSDGRMQALAGASAAFAASTAVNVLKAGQGIDFADKGHQIVTEDAAGNMSGRDATATEKAGGANLAISIGGASSQSTRTTTNNSARGSNIQAGGDVRIQATGAGDDSNVVVQGSRVTAGGTAELLADNTVQLLAAKNTASQASKDRSNSASLGIAIGTGGFGVTASANQARGNADGNDVNWTNTHVQANNVNIQSGGDTDIKGAVVTGGRVRAQIGGNLNIESLQDTSTYRESSKSAGGSLTVGAGVSGSVSASRSNIDSNYASVTEQSGIRAGDGGFQVGVQGETILKGGAVTSTQKAVDEGQNHVESADGLTTSDIQNSASYNARSVGFNVGSAVSLNGQLTPQGTGFGVGSNKGSASSTTQAAISGTAGNKDEQLFGPNTVRQIVPDGEQIARMQSSGGKGLDEVYKVNRPDIDFLNIEYKFVGQDSKTGAQALAKTNDGRQGSVSWITGSNRIENAVGEASASAIYKAVDQGRIESWVVTIRQDGSTSIQVLDAVGKPKQIDTSKITLPGINLSGARP